MFMDFYTTVLTQEQQDFQEKASLLSIQALLDFSTRTPDKVCEKLSFFFQFIFFQRNSYF